MTQNKNTKRLVNSQKTLLWKPSVMFFLNSFNNANTYKANASEEDCTASVGIDRHSSWDGTNGRTIRV
jgi:hypothetical protein